MATLFTRILDGELPGRFVWRDEHCGAFLSIEPISLGHTLVVPRAEIDHWLDLPGHLLCHLNQVGQVIGQAQMRAFRPLRIATLVAGFEVPHFHLHVLPVRGLSDISFANARRREADEMDKAAAALREALRAMGRPETSD